MRAKAAINLEGLSGEFTLVSNPAYTGFAQDQTGLKEMLEKLLAQDSATLKDVQDNMGLVDSLVNSLVNTDMTKQQQ